MCYKLEEQHCPFCDSPFSATIIKTPSDFIVKCACIKYGIALGWLYNASKSLSYRVEVTKRMRIILKREIE
ncbi:hypothetical protein LCGC14_1934810 [marine sediment metagenome]|uniref:Uncharacterized protein n=1 Tax=marine sediment metagenome TaxID=412755 RepID=A0A0F9FMG6_9ZZZZ